MWDLNVGRGWRVGLAILAVLIVFTGGMGVVIFTNSVTIWTFLAGLVILGCLLSITQMIYWLWELINAHYTMDRNALVIHWGHHVHQIPMLTVRSVLSGDEVKRLRTQGHSRMTLRPKFRWPGYFRGHGEAEEIGPILFYATEPLERQIIVCTENMAYAISPADRDAFLAAFRERLEMGPTQDVEATSQQPSLLRWQIWQDNLALGTLGGSVLLLILLTGLLTWRYPSLPSRITLRETPDGQVLLTAAAGRIFYLALMGLIFLVINGTLGLLLYRRQKIAAYFLWSGLLALQSGLWIAVISILTYD
jgi:hypothetical protein